MKISSIGKILVALLLASNAFANGGAEMDLEYKVPPGSKLYDQEATSSAASSTSTASGAEGGLPGAGALSREADVPRTQAAIQKLEASTKPPGGTFANKGKAAVRSCTNAAGRARMACLAQLSEHIQTGAALIGVLTAGMGALSTSEACKKHSDTMKKVQVALTLYNAACSGFQVACNSTCGTSQSQIKAADLEADRLILQAGTNPLLAHLAELAAQDKQLLKQMDLAVKSQIEICQGYKWNLAAAAAGLINTANHARSSKSCEKATTVGDTGGGEGAGGLDTASAKEIVDCSMEKFAQKPECICQRTPNAQGCPGFTGTNSLAGPTGSESPVGSASTDASKLGNFAAATSAGGDSNSAFVSPTGGSAAGGAAGGGSGGGGGGFGGGSGKGGGADGAKKGTGINANILSGYDGGGGGGGRGGMGSGGRYDPASSKYKAYLPGGEKDPTRGIASQTFANGQVTGAGSKSNWEKVSERYKDNKSTLMGN